MHVGACGNQKRAFVSLSAENSSSWELLEVDAENSNITEILSFQSMHLY